VFVSPTAPPTYHLPSAYRTSSLPSSASTVPIPTLATSAPISSSFQPTPQITHSPTQMQPQQLLVLVPRPDGSGVDLVPLQHFVPPQQQPSPSASTQNPLTNSLVNAAIQQLSTALVQAGVIPALPPGIQNLLSSVSAPAPASTSLASLCSCYPASTPAIWRSTSDLASSPSCLSSPTSSPLQSAVLTQQPNIVKAENGEQLPSLCSLELPRPALPLIHLSSSAHRALVLGGHEARFGKH